MQSTPLLCGALALISGLSMAPLAQAQGAETGYTEAVISNPVPFASRATLSDGRIIDFDGQFVTLTSADGLTVTSLHDFGVSNFSGILVPSLDETFVVVGESSNGDLFTVDLSVGGATFVTNLPFNFSAVFESATSLIVSAGAPSFADNNLVRVDLTTGNQTLLAMVEGPSGPVAIDAFGNVYLATVASGFPAPPGGTEVLLYLASQLTGAPVLTEFEGSPIGVGFDGASSMVVDPAFNRVYLAENNFGSGTNRIWNVSGSQASSELLYEGPTGDWVTIDRFDTGTGPGVFAAYQPEAGSGRILAGRTDFFSFDDRFDLTPKRPELNITSAPFGTSTSFTLDVTDGRPNSPMILVYGLTPAPGTPEVSVIPGVLPLLSDFDLGSLEIFPFPLLLDGSGEVSLPFVADSISNVSFQGLVLDEGFFGVATTTRGDV